MTRIVRYYVKPDGQFYGGWEGDPDIYEDPYPEMGYVQVPHAAPSVQWHWNFEKEEFYLPEPAI